MAALRNGQAGRQAGQVPPLSTRSGDAQVNQVRTGAWMVYSSLDRCDGGCPGCG